MKIGSGWTAAALTVGLATSAVAQGAPSKPGSTKPAHGTAGKAPVHRDAWSSMVSALTLTTAQQKKLKPVFDGYDKKGRVIREDKSLSNEQKLAKMQVLLKEAGTKFAQSLNAEQKTK
jgi:Spy/CpxP family protein refolding chaperone